MVYDCYEFGVETFFRYFYRYVRVKLQMSDLSGPNVNFQTVILLILSSSK